MSFDAHAAEYLTSDTHASGDDLDAVIVWAGPRPDERALDVATGPGHVALRLAEAGARVTLLDSAEAMLESAAALLRSGGHDAASVVGSACVMPLPDNAFDLVTCRTAAHHFPDQPAFMREVWRVLTPGGRFVFQDIALPEHTAAGMFVDSFERLRDGSHRRAHPEAGWIRMVQDAGLRVERSQLFGKRHDFGEWCARTGCTEADEAALVAHATRLPRLAAAWLAPEWAGDEDPDVAVSRQERSLLAFTNHHVVLLATKPA